MNYEPPDSTTEIVVDMEATTDYIRDRITNESDRYNFEELVEYERAVMAVKKACDDALAMIRTGQLNLLESSGSRQVGTRVYARVPKNVERFDHSEIAKAVRGQAWVDGVDRETGEQNPNVSIERAVKYMQDLYVAPAVKAKTGGLDKLSVRRRDVVSREAKGHEIRVIELEASDEEE